MPQKNKKLKPQKGLHGDTRILMTELYNITKEFREKAKEYKYKIPDIIKALRERKIKLKNKMPDLWNPDSRKDYCKIVHIFNVGREIAKQVLKAMNKVFKDDRGKKTHTFVDFEGNVLTRQQAEEQFKKLLDFHKIPYEYYDSVSKTFRPMTDFMVREMINQRRLTKPILSSEKVLEDMILTDDKIRITDKTAIESLPDVKKTHQKYLIDGLSPKESKKNIWEEAKKSKDNNNN